MSSSQPGTCPCQGAAGRPAILYALLSPGLRARPSVPPAQSRCLCRQHRPVQLCAPHRTCREALDVLARTVGFLRSLPAFCQLPPQDQQRLLRGCWGPLFLLGLAQNTVTFEVAEAPVPSILKKILLEEPSSSAGGGQLPDRPQPSLAAVQWLRGCLESFWSLELGPKEYAYLKETILFNPDVPGLHAASHIGLLQQEAHHALWEVLEPWCPAGQGRLARVLLTASTLKSVPPSLLEDLFFRPIVGDIDIAGLLEDMLLLSQPVPAQAEIKSRWGRGWQHRLGPAVPKGDPVLPGGPVRTGRPQLPWNQLVVARQDGLWGPSLTTAPLGPSGFDLVLQLSSHPSVVLGTSGPRLPTSPEMGTEA